jgi:hypothetical protein
MSGASNSDNQSGNDRSLTGRRLRIASAGAARRKSRSAAQVNKRFNCSLFGASVHLPSACNAAARTSGGWGGSMQSHSTGPARESSSAASRRTTAASDTGASGVLFFLRSASCRM